MKFNRANLTLFVRPLLVFISLFATSYTLLNQWYLAGIVLAPVIIYQFYDYYRFHKKAQTEIQQFVESVHYRDFSRYFDVERAPLELQAFRSGFNEINSTFKVITREKETQYLYLKTILEIVDTGILSYEIKSGETLWMNESLKNLLKIPYLKTIYSLEKRQPDLYKELLQLQPGHHTVITLHIDANTFKVQLSATVFQNDNKMYKLIAFQNINEALDETESQAWQKLLSVMTHEIMNSVAPISSLAETLKHRIADSMVQPDQYKEALLDIETGIGTIKKRSEGLLKFTDTYRNLSKINKVNISKVYVHELFEHVQRLLQPNIEKKNIDFEILLKDPLLSINVDSGLIEQVLINLMLNAMDAVKETENPKITLAAESSISNKITIRISDNGSGISDELLDKIFIPFFSTKKTGSGIGLSLCKQVMMLHKGQINVQSKEGVGTVFSLVF